MNKLLLVLILLGLSSCSSPNYEKAIGDWIQTDETGTWTDMKFELLEVQETKDLTVADSILILKKRFEKMKESKLDSCKKVMNRGMIMGFNRYNYHAIEEMNRKRYQAFKQQLDSIPFHYPYSNRDTTDVLAKYMKCQYSIFAPELQAKQIKVETFLLTPDMKKCLARMKKNI